MTRHLHGPIRLSHKRLYRSYLDAYAPEICENTFASLYAWRHATPVQALEADGSLVIFVSEPQGCRLYGPPLGPMSASDAVDIIQEHLGKPVISVERMTEVTARDLANRGWHMEQDRDNFDYVYCRSSLAELSGRHYHRKRNLICQCLRAHACLYESIRPENHAEVLEVLRAWHRRKNAHLDYVLHAEGLAIVDMLQHYDDLDIVGGAVRVDGCIQAFSMAARLNATTAVVHFEKANTEIRGLYQLLNKWFAEHALADYEFVNREQDNGHPGLMRAKQSYFPVSSVRKFRASYNSTLEYGPGLHPSPALVVPGT